MSSLNSDDENLNRSRHSMFTQNCHQKRKKDYICPCGRPYGSYPALYAHIKRKHDGKAPGEIIKPKSVRRRGRPFKYVLQNQNSHRSASKHLEDYLRKGPSQTDHLNKTLNGGEINEYPLKQFADQNSKPTFPHFKPTLQQNPRQKFTAENRSPEAENLKGGSEASLHQFDMKEEKNRLLGNLDAQNNKEFYQMVIESRIPHQERPRMFPYEEKSGNYPFVSHENLEKDKIKNYKRFIHDQESLLNQGLYQTDPVYDRFQFQQQQIAQNTFQRPYEDSIDALYFRPFEMTLREEMEAKFKPIAQGIIEFLEPILKQLFYEEQTPVQQKPILIEDQPCQKVQELQPEQNEIQFIDKNPQQHSKIQHKQNQYDSVQITVADLLEKQHFRDILKWLMTPPEEISIHRMKENYIEFNFRCCLVEFLDFLHNFLETVQYEQILLIVVFFCDHILAETESFQIQPEPQIYEMGMFYNSFLNDYLPKLGKFMPYLQKFYIFKDFKKKVSEFFMWMSSWQAIQQYYHNKFYRQKINYEIQQENYKCLMYQRKYQAYMKEVMRETTLRIPHKPGEQIGQIGQNQEGEEKAESNPEMIIVNTEQSFKSHGEIDQRDILNIRKDQDDEKNHVNVSNSAKSVKSGQQNQRSIIHQAPQDEIKMSEKENNQPQNSETPLLN